MSSKLARAMGATIDANLRTKNFVEGVRDVVTSWDKMATNVKQGANKTAKATETMSRRIRKSTTSAKDSIDKTMKPTISAEQQIKQLREMVIEYEKMERATAAAAAKARTSQRKTATAAKKVGVEAKNMAHMVKDSTDKSKRAWGELAYATGKHTNSIRGRIQRFRHSFWLVNFVLKRSRSLILGIATGFGLAYIIKRSVEAADVIAKLGDATGVTTDRIQEMHYAATRTGATIENVNSALKAATRRFGELQFKSNSLLGKAIGAFDKELLVKLKVETNFDTQLDTFLKTVANLKSETLRAGLMKAAFGAQQGSALLNYVGLGEAGMERIRQEAHDKKTIIDKEVMPEMSKLADTFGIFGEQMSRAYTELYAAMSPLIKGFVQLGTVLIPGVADIMTWTLRFVSKNSRGVFQTPEEKVADLDKQIARLRARTAPAEALPWGEAQAWIQRDKEIKALEERVAATKKEERVIGDMVGFFLAPLSGAALDHHELVKEYNLLSEQLYGGVGQWSKFKSTFTGSQVATGRAHGKSRNISPLIDRGFSLTDKEVANRVAMDKVVRARRFGARKDRKEELGALIEDSPGRRDWELWQRGQTYMRDQANLPKAEAGLESAKRQHFPLDTLDTKQLLHKRYKVIADGVLVEVKAFQKAFAKEVEAADRAAKAAAELLAAVYDPIVKMIEQFHMTDLERRIQESIAKAVVEIDSPEARQIETALRLLDTLTIQKRLRELKDKWFEDINLEISEFNLVPFEQAVADAFRVMELDPSTADPSVMKGIVFRIRMMDHLQLDKLRDAWLENTALAIEEFHYTDVEKQIAAALRQLELRRATDPVVVGQVIAGIQTLEALRLDELRDAWYENINTQILEFDEHPLIKKFNAALRANELDLATGDSAAFKRVIRAVRELSDLEFTKQFDTYMEGLTQKIDEFHLSDLERELAAALRQFDFSEYSPLGTVHMKKIVDKIRALNSLEIGKVLEGLQKRLNDFYMSEDAQQVLGMMESLSLDMQSSVPGDAASARQFYTEAMNNLQQLDLLEVIDKIAATRAEWFMKIDKQIAEFHMSEIEKELIEVSDKLSVGLARGNISVIKGIVARLRKLDQLELDKLRDAWLENTALAIEEFRYTDVEKQIAAALRKLELRRATDPVVVGQVIAGIQTLEDLRLDELRDAWYQNIHMQILRFDEHPIWKKFNDALRANELDPVTGDAAVFKRLVRAVRKLSDLEFFKQFDTYMEGLTQKIDDFHLSDLERELAAALRQFDFGPYSPLGTVHMKKIVDKIRALNSLEIGKVLEGLQKRLNDFYMSEDAQQVLGMMESLSLDMQSSVPGDAASARQFYTEAMNSLQQLDLLEVIDKIAATRAEWFMKIDKQIAEFHMSEIEKELIEVSDKLSVGLARGNASVIKGIVTRLQKLADLADTEKIDDLLDKWLESWEVRMAQFDMTELQKKIDDELRKLEMDAASPNGMAISMMLMMEDIKSSRVRLQEGYDKLMASIRNDIEQIGLGDVESQLSEAMKSLGDRAGPDLRDSIRSILTEKQTKQDAQELKERIDAYIKQMDFDVSQLGARGLQERLDSALFNVGTTADTGEGRRLVDKLTTGWNTEAAFMMDEYIQNTQAQRRVDLIEEAVKLQNALLTPTQEYIRGVRRVNRLLREGLIFQETANLAIAQLKEDLLGIKDPLAQLTEAAQEMGRSFGSALESLIFKLGKASDVLRTFALELLQIFARKFVFGGIEDWASGLFGAALGAPDVPEIPDTSAPGWLKYSDFAPQPRAFDDSVIPTRDKGGYVQAHRDYLTAKPELFTPGQSGWITPFDKMGGGRQKIEVHNHINIQSTDGPGVRKALSALVPAIVAASAEQSVSTMQLALSRPGFAG